MHCPVYPGLRPVSKGEVGRILPEGLRVRVMKRGNTEGPDPGADSQGGAWPSLAIESQGQ